MYVYFYMTSVLINQTNRYMLFSLNTDDINYANKTLSLCMCVHLTYSSGDTRFDMNPAQLRQFLQALVDRGVIDLVDGLYMPCKK